jgi:hypothetical protein
LRAQPDESGCTNSRASHGRPQSLRGPLQKAAALLPFHYRLERAVSLSPLGLTPISNRSTFDWGRKRYRLLAANSCHETGVPNRPLAHESPRCARRSFPFWELRFARISAISKTIKDSMPENFSSRGKYAGALTLSNLVCLLRIALLIAEPNPMGTMASGS